MYTIRNSASKLLAVSVLSLFPKAQLVSGEVTDLGFYYDFFLPDPIGEKQLPFIEERMRDFMRQDMPIKVMEMMRKNAMELFKHHRQDLKVVLLKENVETIVHVCQIGQFYDLGYPPHVESMNQIGVIKLMNISTFKISLPGRPNITLTRIQGTAFPDAKSLKEFFKRVEEAKKRDHRQIGKEMQLFSQEEELSPGGWFWLPKGMILKETLLDWWKKERVQQKYQFVSTPVLLKKHIDNEGGALLESGGTQYHLAATKAAMHAALFKSKLRSYRDLPVKYSEWWESYDPGKEGLQWGLLRAKSFITEASYTFCSPDQLINELISSLQFIDKIIKIFAFEVNWHLVVKNRYPVKSKKNWEESQANLVKALKACGFSYTLDNEGKAPYGPIVEVRFKDALGRAWKGPSLYIDLYHSEKYGLHYQGLDDQMHATVMIGQSMFGSLERMVAILIEHYVGVLPLWLAPEQVRVIPVADKNAEYAAQVYAEMRQAGFRVGLDSHKGNLGVKIHAAENERVPHMIIVGDKEMLDKTVTLRQYQQETLISGVAAENYIRQLRSEIASEK